MKILWITNILFPDVCKALNIDAPVIGGWMYSSAMALLEKNMNIELSVASLYSCKELQILHLNQISYYLLPKINNDKSYDINLEVYWNQVKENFSPDIVHIHGSEFPHGLAYIKACGSKNVVLSIQGLVSVYERFYYGGISEKILRKNTTIRDLIRRDTIFDQRHSMQQRGNFEKQIIRSVNHVIGRTSWDQAHVWANNPKLKYHYCNETLRAEFYKYKWEYMDCEKNSIFLSQAHYAIKGLQQVIYALPFIIREFPDTKLYIAGIDFKNKSKWRQNGFERFICSLISKIGLDKSIIFAGTLSEYDMCKRFLKTNVFVCPSSIENSPNSIGEAQLMGVPCVASYVGGMSDMIKHEESGLLYRFEEIEMLATSINRIFSEPLLAQHLSSKGRAVAKLRHDKTFNTNRLIEVYNDIKVKTQ